MTLFDVIKNCPGTRASPIVNHLLSWVWKAKARYVKLPHLEMKVVVNTDSPTFLKDNVIFLCVVPRGEWDAAFPEDAKKQVTNERTTP